MKMIAQFYIKINSKTIKIVNISENQKIMLYQMTEKSRKICVFWQSVRAFFVKACL